jgi:hypothetical protein
MLISTQDMKRPPVPAGEPPETFHELLVLPAWRAVFAYFLVEEKCPESMDCWMAVESVREAIRDARARAERHATGVGQILRMTHVVPNDLNGLISEYCAVPILDEDRVGLLTLHKALFELYIATDAERWTCGGLCPQIRDALRVMTSAGGTCGRPLWANRSRCRLTPRRWWWRDGRRCARIRPFSISDSTC